MNVPANWTVVADLRDVSIIELPLPKTDGAPKMVNRIAVLFDADRDMRVIDVLAALSFQRPDIREHVVALSETKGRVTCWYGGTNPSIDAMRNPLQAAARAATWPTDLWFSQAIAAPMIERDGERILDRDNLPARDLLKQNLPARFELGRVKA